MPDRYWVGGTDTWNNVAGTKWSATSGGAGGASAPTSADDVFFDANSGSGTVTTAANAICSRANFNGFTGTFNAATNWTISFDLTFGAGMTITGTGTIIKTGSGGTWTFNGKTYTGGWSYPTGNGFSTTIGDNLVFDGSIAGGINSNLTATSARTITVRTNLTWAGGVNLNNVSFIMGGTGNLSGGFTRTGGIPGITINTPGGTINHNATIQLAGIAFTYTAGTWNSTAAIQFGGTFGNFMNNVSTITFGSMSFLAAAGQSVALNSDMYVTSGLSNTVTNSTINGPGRLYIGGNIAPTAQIGGTAVIEMYGSTNALLGTGTLVNSLIINKATSGTTVTLNGNLTWGGNNNQLTLTTGTFVPQNFTVTIPGGIVVTVNGMTFWILSLTANVTMIQNAPNTIQNTLVCGGNTTFQGTRGWTTNTFTCTAAASIITLQNINANPLAEYRITGLLTLIGTLASRITLQSAGFATFTGTINPVGQLNIASGTAPSIGMTISQATGISPNGLIGLLPNRPVITGGSNPTFTISPSATATLGSTSMRAGFKAKFILENNGVATQNVGYVTTQDIDSSDGQTIFSFGSNQDNVSSNVSLFRTLNWNPLISPTGSIAHTFVN
jgi:hypothetical protein